MAWSHLHLTKLFGIKAKLVYAIDKYHFSKAIALAASGNYDVLHLSSHGDNVGLAMTDNKPLGWSDLAALFAKHDYNPSALVMSACCGASDNIGEAFENVTTRPEIIFGTTDARDYNEYALAWTILYNKFNQEGVDRDVAQQALKEIHATGGSTFRHLRWDGRNRYYRNFPVSGKSYRIEEFTLKEKPKKKST